MTILILENYECDNHFLQKGSIIDIQEMEIDHSYDLTKFIDCNGREFELPNNVFTLIQE